MLAQITPVVLTYNEAANIGRTLTALEWASDVLVVDSFSNDETLDICARFANVRVLQREFDNAAAQCNYALRQNLRTDWVLSMDADYVVSAQLREELTGLEPDRPAYAIDFIYCLDGQPLRGSLYPPRTCLYRCKNAHYIQDGHTQRVVIDGEVGKLQGKMLHDDRKPRARWMQSQYRYATQEAAKLKTTRFADLNFQDKLRWLGLAPLVIVPYTLLVKGLILNLGAGIRYTGQRFTAEWLLLKARLGLL